MRSLSLIISLIVKEFNRRNMVLLRLKFTPGEKFFQAQDKKI